MKFLIGTFCNFEKDHNKATGALVKFKIALEGQKTKAETRLPDFYKRVTSTNEHLLTRFKTSLLSDAALGVGLLGVRKHGNGPGPGALEGDGPGSPRSVLHNC